MTENVRAATGVAGYRPGTAIPGVLAGLGAGFTYGMFGIFGKKAVARYHYWTTVCYSLGFGTLFLWLAKPPWTLAERAFPPEAWGALLYLAVIPTLAAYGLYHTGLAAVVIAAMTPGPRPHRPRR